MRYARKGKFTFIVSIIQREHFTIQGHGSCAMKSKERIKKPRSIIFGALKQVMGIEPTSQPWEGRVLPMNYTCISNKAIV